MPTVGERIIRSAREAVAFAKGQNVPNAKNHVPAQIDVHRIRHKVGMSQTEFAEHFGVSVRTIQDWEQERRVPTGAARAFLIVIDREPHAVERALRMKAA